MCVCVYHAFFTHFLSLALCLSHTCAPTLDGFLACSLSLSRSLACFSLSRSLSPFLVFSLALSLYTCTHTQIFWFGKHGDNMHLSRSLARARSLSRSHSLSHPLSLCLSLPPPSSHPPSLPPSLHAHTHTMSVFGFSQKTADSTHYDCCLWAGVTCQYPRRVVR